MVMIVDRGKGALSTGFTPCCLGAGCLGTKGVATGDAQTQASACESSLQTGAATCTVPGEVTASSTLSFTAALVGNRFWLCFAVAVAAQFCGAGVAGIEGGC